MKTGLLLLCTLLVLLSPVAGAEFRAGAAARVVTPEPLLPVSGGVGVPSPVTRKEGDLVTSALVLDSGDTKVAIVSAPFLGFPAVLGNRVRAQVKGIPAANIVIGATHVHSAPDCYGFPDKEGKPSSDAKYLDLVVARMAEAINEAVANLRPAGLKIATAEAAEKIAYNYYAPELYDRRCSVIQALDSNGKPIATLVNYAIHPEIIGDSQGILSPDLVGPLYDRLAAEGGGVGVFMNSAQGGMVTADCRGADGKDVQTWAECQRIGNLLADEALRIVKAAPVQQNPALFCAAKTVTFPVTAPLMLALMKALPAAEGAKSEDGTKISVQMNVLNIGTAQVLTIPGEALPNIGFYLKRKMHGLDGNSLLFGLTNDAFGYILTKVDYDSFPRYNYVSRTSLGEQTGEILIEEGLKFVDSCPAPKAAQ